MTLVRAFLAWWRAWRRWGTTARQLREVDRARRERLRRLNAIAVLASIGLLVAPDFVEAAGWQRALATWYGPGLYYENGMACGGGQLTPSTWGVATRLYACGTTLTLRYKGRTATARVVDRTGAGHPGFDLTVPVCRALAHCWTGSIEFHVGGVAASPAPPASPRIPTTGPGRVPPSRSGPTLPPTDTEP